MISKRLLFLLVCLVSISMAPSGVAQAQTAEDSFASATKAYADGEFDFAVPGFTRAMSLDSTLRPRCYAYLGRIHRLKGDLQKAVEAFEAAIRFRYSPSWLLAEYSETLVALDSVDKGIQVVRDEIERNPNTTWARHSLATIYEQLGKYGEATAAWQSALNRMPDDEIAKVGIARIYVQQGRLDEAKKIALGLDINECVNISLRIVEAYLKTGNVPEADVVMTRLLNSSPRFSLHVYIELASAYTKRSRPDRVREVLGAAKRVILNTQESSPEWNLQAARLLWEATDYVVAARYARNALEEYKKQLEAYPFSQRVYEKTGFCYLLLGELASARESFQQFTSLATPDERRSVISELQEWIDGGIVLADASYILEKTLGLKSPATANPPPPVERVSTTPKDTIAPSIVIQQPKDTRGIKIVETQKYSVQVSGLAADENGVSVVYVNGILANLSSPTSAEISESGFSGKVVKFAADAMLTIGENTIEVRAVDVNGNQAKVLFKIQRTAKEERPLEPKLKLPQIWAVVVGISEYQNKELQLSFAHKDAQAFYSFLKSPYGGAIPDERIELLTNRNATRAEIIRALNEKLRMAFEDDMVIVYIASHGVPEEVSGELYFLGYDADTRNIAGTAISQIDVQKSISTARAKKIVFIADACHSGSIGLSSDISRRASVASYVNRLLKEVAAARDGVAILTASSSNEFSQEGAQWGGHGVFTYHLVNGLNGEADTDGDGYVTIRELYEYIYRKVADDTGGKQHPDLQGKFDNNLPVSVVR